MSRTAVAFLSTENLLHNCKVIKSLAPKSKIIAMVKANAYGHGLRSTSLRLDGNVDVLGVASIDEALALRKVGVKIPIMLAEGVFEPNELSVAAAENFHVVFHNNEQISWIQKSYLSSTLQAWIKVNTGMGRLGFSISDGRKNYEILNQNPSIAKPIRIISHFACADDVSHELNQKQINNFKGFIEGLDTECSMCNSAGIFGFPEMHYDYVRPGIAIYGISPFADKTASELNLKPVMTLTSSLIAVNLMKKGDSIGYGGRFICDEDMPVGIVAFGYGDGYPLTARDGTPILVNNTRCQIVGRVSMDMLAVDLRNASMSKVGDPVILWGEQLPIEEIVHHTSNIVWDILTGIQNRVKFIWTTHDKLHPTISL